MASGVRIECPMKDSDAIYRYMSMERYLDMIENGRLSLSHLSYWEDPFEAFIIRGGIKYYQELGQDPLPLYEAFKYVYGQSWTTRETESDVIWRAMGDRGKLVRVKVSVGNLRSILKSKNPSGGAKEFPIRIAKVSYMSQRELEQNLNQETLARAVSDQSQDLSDKIGLFFMKREEFALEEEVRILAIPGDDDLNAKACSDGGALRFKVNPTDLIEEVLLDPRMERNKVEQIICRTAHVWRRLAAPACVKIDQSQLMAWPEIDEINVMGPQPEPVNDNMECFKDYLVQWFGGMTKTAQSVYSRVLRVFHYYGEYNPTEDQLEGWILHMDEIVRNSGSAGNCRSALRHYRKAVFGI